MSLFGRDKAPATGAVPVVPHAIELPEPEDPGDTLYALVRRKPSGWGYAVVVGFVEQDTTPEIDPDVDRSFITLAAAVRFAATAPLYSIHPECYRSPSKFVKGLL